MVGHPLALVILRRLTERVEVVGVLLAFAASLTGVLLAQWVAPWPSSLLLGTPMPAGQRRSMIRSRIEA